MEKNEMTANSERADDKDGREKDRPAPDLGHAESRTDGLSQNAVDNVRKLHSVAKAEVSKPFFRSDNRMSFIANHLYHRLPFPYFNFRLGHVIHSRLYDGVVILSVILFACHLGYHVTEGKTFATQMSTRVVETQYGRLRGVLITLPPIAYPSVKGEGGGGIGGGGERGRADGSLGDGETRTMETRRVEAYYGLQYASVLGGELRFMPPTGPMEKWDGIRVAMKYRAVCPQRLTVMSSGSFPDKDPSQVGTRPAASDQIPPLSASFGLDPAGGQIPGSTRKGKVSRPSKPDQVGDLDGDNGGGGRGTRRWKALLPFLDKQLEECLSVNIYVPARESNDTTLLPVLLFIHSESYEVGTGNAYDGSVMAAYGQIVVITINYRLGALGFLSTADHVAPGNYALLDLIAGLHYIRENIAAFGGDANDVTLMGSEYGSVMVNLLLISPVTKGKGLFKRAILIGASALSSWAVVEDPLRYTRDLAIKVNCTLPISAQSTQSEPAHLDHPALIQCLKKLPTETLARVQVTAPRYQSSFGPVIDRRSILPDTASALMDSSSPSSGPFDTTALLIALPSRPGHDGVTFNPRRPSAGGEDQYNEDEREPSGGLNPRKSRDKPPAGSAAGENTPGGVVGSEWGGVSETNRRKFLRTFVQNVFEFHRQKIYDILAYQYTDWENRSGGGDAVGGWSSDIMANEAAHSVRGVIQDEERSSGSSGRDRLHELIFDGQYVAPAVETARLHSSRTNAAPTYLFSFASSSPPTSAPAYGVLGPADDSDWGSASPLADLALVFGAPLTNGISPWDGSGADGFSSADKLASDAVMNFWTNFIKYGNPNTPVRGMAGGSSTGSTGQRPRPGSSTFALSSPDVREQSTGSSYWPTFDLDNQLYMHLAVTASAQKSSRNRTREFDVRPVVDHHYRRSKMALWLDLIPRIHKADNLGPRFHLLDDFDNLTSYDIEDVDRQRLAQLIQLFPPSTTTPAQTASTPTLHDPSLTVTSPLPGYAADASHVTLMRFASQTVRRGGSAVGGGTGGVTAGKGGSKGLSSPRPLEAGKALVEDAGGLKTTTPKNELQVPLSVTLAVGCGLLTLNILVFVIIYRQRRRTAAALRHARKNGDKNWIGGGGGAGGGRDDLELCHDVDADVSAGDVTPKLSAAGQEETDSNSSLTSIYSSKNKDHLHASNISKDHLHNSNISRDHLHSSNISRDHLHSGTTSRLSQPSAMTSQEHHSSQYHPSQCPVSQLHSKPILQGGAGGVLQRSGNITPGGVVTHPHSRDIPPSAPPPRYPTLQHYPPSVTLLPPSSTSSTGSPIAPTNPPSGSSTVYATIPSRRSPRLPVRSSSRGGAAEVGSRGGTRGGGPGGSRAGPIDRGSSEGGGREGGSRTEGEEDFQESGLPSTLV